MMSLVGFEETIRLSEGMLNNVFPANLTQTKKSSCVLSFVHSSGNRRSLNSECNWKRRLKTIENEKMKNSILSLHRHLTCSENGVDDGMRGISS